MAQPDKNPNRPGQHNPGQNPGAEAQHAAGLSQDALRAGMSAARDTAEHTARTGAEAGRRTAEAATDQFGQAFDVMTRTGTAWTSGMQDLSREWFSLFEQSLSLSQRAMGAWSQSRPVSEAISAQGDVTRESLERMMTTTRRMGDIVMRMLEQAGRNAQPQQGPGPH